MRKIIQMIHIRHRILLVFGASRTLVLCNDGTLWLSSKNGWKEVAPIPQPEQESQDG